MGIELYSLIEIQNNTFVMQIYNTTLLSWKIIINEIYRYYPLRSVTVVGYLSVAGDHTVYTHSSRFNFLYV